MSIPTPPPADQFTPPLAKLTPDSRPKVPAKIADSALPDNLKKVFHSAGLTEMYKPAVRSTAVKDYRTCQRKFLLRYRFGLTAKFRWSQALFLGGVFHEIIAEMLKGHSVEVGIDKVRHTLRELRDELEGAVDALGLLPDGRTPQSVLADAEMATEKAATMATVYGRRFSPIPEGFTVLTVEKQIHASISGLTWPITGRLDVLLEEDSTGDLWILDHKTVGDSPLKLARALGFDLQPQVYQLLAMAAYPKRRIAGVIHNMIQKPTIRRRKARQPETLEEYTARVNDWYTERIVMGDSIPEKDPMLRSIVRFYPRAVGMLEAEAKSDDDATSGFATTMREVCTAARRMPLPRFYPEVANNYICHNIFGTCPYIDLCGKQSIGEWAVPLGQFSQRDPATQGNANTDDTE